MIYFLRFMAFITEFEVAITPSSARHYAQLKTDAERWRGEVDRYQISKMYNIK